MITHDRLLRVLRYDPGTGFFTWIDCHPAKQRMIGARAGRVGVAGTKIMIDRKNYFAHRLAWFYMHGIWPSQYIDHINGDPCDNRLSNLREASARQNMFNKRTQKNNRLGVKGVTRSRTPGKFMAVIRIDGRQTNLGTFESIDLARAAYAEAALATRGEFARLS